jgi:hypothetical protein
VDANVNQGQPNQGQGTSPGQDPIQALKQAIDTHLSGPHPTARTMGAVQGGTQQGAVSPQLIAEVGSLLNMLTPLLINAIVHRLSQSQPRA